MTMRNLVAPALLATLLFAAPASAEIQLAVNGDFETGDFTGWKVFDGSNSPNGGVISISNDTPFGSTYSGLLESNLGSPSNPTLKQERVGAGIVKNNQDVTISFDAKGQATAGGVQFVEFFTETEFGGASSSNFLIHHRRF